MDVGVVFLGVATQDTIALVDRYPSADERVIVEELEEAGGGPAATAAVACVRLGVPASFVGSVGDDATGRRIVDDLAAEGLDVSGVSFTSDRSGASVVVVDKGRATRAIFNRPANAPTLSTTALELVRAASWLHVDQLGWQVLAPLRNELPGSVNISVDAGNPIEGFHPEGVALYVPTISALRSIYGEGAPADLLNLALDDGAEVVVATDGSRGSWAAGQDRKIVHVPAAEGLPIRSTLGAGDVFHGALVAAVVREYDLQQALEYANYVAAHACGALDGRSGIPTHPEVRTALSKNQES